MFRVEWIQAAIDELTDLWTRSDSTERHAITVATHAIDKELAADPYRESESRGSSRLAFSPARWMMDLDEG